MAYDSSKVAGGKGNFSLNQNFEAEGVDLTLLTVDFINDMSAETGDLTTGSTTAGLQMVRHAFEHQGLRILAEGPLVDSNTQKTYVVRTDQLDSLSSTTTKAALNGFVKSISVDYIKDGIRCNAILPGTVETPSWEGRVQMADDPEQARKDFISRQAMGRLAQPNEIASMAVYLASDESDFVTGTLNLIDGGWTL